MDVRVDCDSEFEWAEYLARNPPLARYPELRPDGVWVLRDIAAESPRDRRPLLVVLSGLPASGKDLAAIALGESGPPDVAYSAYSVVVPSPERLPSYQRAADLRELADLHSRRRVLVVYLRADPRENYRRLSDRWHGRQGGFAEHLRLHRFLEARWAEGAIVLDADRGPDRRSHADVAAIVDAVRRLVEP